MDLGIRGRVAIVAASSKGLGLAVAHALAAEGATLAMCSRDVDALQRAAVEVGGKHGVNVFYSPVDVTQYEQVRSFVDRTVQKYGRLDICVTNAGGPPSKGFLDVSVEEWRKAVDLNLMSTVFFARETIPHMQRAKWGRLVTITSVSVKQPIDGLILSNAVRAGATGLAKTLANEFAKDNILVNNVCPGYTLTDRLADLGEAISKARGISVEQARAMWTSAIPMGRMGRPEEFAAMVAFLCSEQASYVTGTSIPVDGGFVKGLL
jgi:3-oxoacyl-[acyl-carrier protein] reductase